MKFGLIASSAAVLNSSMSSDVSSFSSHLPQPAASLSLSLPSATASTSHSRAFSPEPTQYFNPYPFESLVNNQDGHGNFYQMNTQLAEKYVMNKDFAMTLLSINKSYGDQQRNHYSKAILEKLSGGDRTKLNELDVKISNNVHKVEKTLNTIQNHFKKEMEIEKENPYLLSEEIEDTTVRDSVKRYIELLDDIGREDLDSQQYSALSSFLGDEKNILDLEDNLFKLFKAATTMHDGYEETIHNIYNPKEDKEDGYFIALSLFIDNYPEMMELYRFIRTFHAYHGINEFSYPERFENILHLVEDMYLATKNDEDFTFYNVINLGKSLDLNESSTDNKGLFVS